MTSTTHPIIPMGRKAAAIFLTAFSLSACAVPVSIDADCAWSKPILFSDETKGWLIERIPWPGHLRQDLVKIAKHNEKFGVFCG